MTRILPIKNSELGLAIKTLFAEYWQKPLLNLGFIISLAIATSTLLAVLLLNHASKQQYQQADSRLGSPVAFQINAIEGGAVSKQDFAHIRRQGFSEVSPIISFRKKIGDDKWLTFKAMDLLALSLRNPEKFDTTSVLIPKAYASRLGLQFNHESQQSKLSLANKQSLPIRQIDSADWGMTALVDIALAWQFFPEVKGFSYLLVSQLTEKRREKLENSLPEHLILQPSWSLQQREGFADALHLNLSALATLSFVVSLFIAFQAAEQAWQNRSRLSAQLRLFGIGLSAVRQAMLLEALLLILLASILGTIIAITIVSVLLPVLGLTLNQLYQLNVSGHFDWHWQYLGWSLLISSFAVLMSLLKQIIMMNRRNIVLVSKSNRLSFSYSAFGIAGVLLLLGFSFWPENNWQQIMMKFGILLIATVALLPLTLKMLIHLLLLFKMKIGLNYRLSYILQDAGQQIACRFLPLAAFYLALTASIAAALMVSSFETAFIKYLDKQLNEDLYIRFNRGEQQRIELWLQQQPQIKEYVLYKHGIVNVGVDTVAITTYQSSLQLASLVMKTTDMPMSKFASKVNHSAAFNSEDNVCLINEQLALAHQLDLGDMLAIDQGVRHLNCQIRAIYFDYGNPAFEITLPLQLAEDSLSGLIAKSFGVFFYHYTAESKQKLINELALDESKLIEPAEIKSMAMTIFSQTFILTKAIAFVLLTIACFGLFLSAKTIELARKGDLIILASLGYSRVELFIHMLGQWLLLVIACILLSWPMAIVLAKVLVGKILPISFGWSMPLVLAVSPFVSGSLIALLCLLPALIIPLYQLRGRVQR